MASVARFYGWNHWEIENLPSRTYWEYFKAMRPVKAQEALNDLQVITYPHMKKEGRSKLYNFLRRQVNNWVKRPITQTKSRIRVLRG